MNNIKVVPTNDGSSTLFSEKFNAYYHSTNGALTESQHIFIQNGFMQLADKLPLINVLEIGLGTCLNAALTAGVSAKLNLKTLYYGIELYPPENEVAQALNYPELLSPTQTDMWKRIVNAAWNTNVEINDNFSIFKHLGDFCSWIPASQKFDLIYFDAFAPDDQTEMWSMDNFQKLFDVLTDSGILVTYSSKGIVKRTLREVGFNVKRIPGPPGKRHILMATKNSV
ncbi:MAG TPA: tRNA (5-methylaminomethyl-2-thiouridine)(34)-methyltransferase MnmD [Tenuifilaceae bacterium]|nr:tRNA (5-methylaminomethyl-2-thiouridine)(34)-methyltransferase MnmD [Tenuifilaceae bacterium]